MNPIKDVVIVGSGTAGLIAALYLKFYFPQFNVKIVKSSKINIIGVGESTTEHWGNFIQDVNIDPIELINESNATIKIGVLFKNWTYPGSKYVHSVSNVNSPILSRQSTVELYNRLVLNNFSNNPFVLSYPFNEIYYKNKVVVSSNLTPTNQFHFDTFKLNSYLQKICLKRNIKIEEHFIKNINQNEKGKIVSLTNSNNNIIKGDFFIDCSGFKRVLSSKLSLKTISYKDFLPVNEAITFATPLNQKNGIEPYTSATSLSSGWAWKIPTQTQYGNGYVFDNRYINCDNALNEFNQHLGTNIENVAKNIKFEAYKLEKFWHKNCVSIGLSSSFSEPLEAQSIGFSIIQSSLLVESLNSWMYDSLNTTNRYNKEINNCFDNIIDYVQLHYFTKKNNSKFWKEKPFKITEFNKNTFEKFSIGIFSPQDFSSNNLMFTILNFYQIYFGLNLLNTSKIKLLQSLNKEWGKKWDDIYHNSLNKENYHSISHVDYIKLLKENYSS